MEPVVRAKPKKMYADEVKALVVSAILPTLAFDEVLGSEVRFGDGRYRADLVISSPGRLSAIEIKGPRDNLDKLPDQVEGYKVLFLDFSVAADDAWITAVRSQLPRSAGLMAMRGSHIRALRAPRRREHLSKEAALQWLHTNDLRVLLRSYGLPSRETYETLATHARNELSVSQLSSFALKTVHQRLQARFEVFRSELGQTVTLDDVRILTLNDRVSGGPVEPGELDGNSLD